MDNTIKGRIVKGIAGFYYVSTLDEHIVYECKAKGSFRKDKLKPLVGDYCLFECIDSTNHTGNVVEILPRSSELIRPAVANIDQALIVFALKQPEPNINLLDRFLVMIESKGLDCIICFNKEDIADREYMDYIESEYSNCGHKLIFISVKNKENLDELRSLLEGKTTAIAGPSGVGKSSLINELLGDFYMETGEVSDKIDRGRHTTRHTEVFPLCGIKGESYIMDTPGFTSLDVPSLTETELSDYYREFDNYRDLCRFAGCLHAGERDCKVKQAVAEGHISKVRYDNYLKLLAEIKDRKKY